MKRSINLIADILVETEPPPSPWRVLALVSVALLVPSLVWGLHTRKASQLDPQVVELQSTRDKLLRSHDQLEQSVRELQTRNTQLRTERALAEQIQWEAAFRELTHIVPSGVWLSDLGKPEKDSTAGVGATEDLTIGVQGLAISLGTLANLLHNLEESQFFREPRVLYTERSVGKGVAKVSFSIQCLLRRSPPRSSPAG